MTFGEARRAIARDIELVQMFPNKLVPEVFRPRSPWRRWNIPPQSNPCTRAVSRCVAPTLEVDGTIRYVPYFLSMMMLGGLFGMWSRRTP
jgi:hypothetical protein